MFKMTSKAKKPRKVNGYKMPAPIPAGFIIKNSQKKAWKIGTSVGKGGFGEIYSCCPVDENGTVSSKSKSLLYPHVMKIEPQENGPLFVEMHFYMKVAKKEDMENWMKKKGIKRLGMPCYLGSGSFEYNSDRYRFIVMDRYGKDLWSLFLENNKIFPCSTALQVALQIVDVLEYIHDQGYAHCDVKGSNLLLGTHNGNDNQVHLVDFGLASKYIISEFKPDPKKAHNGTIEYTSRDAHLGVITRRGDMEILGFNLLHWVTSSLPWENTTDPQVAEQKKISLMNNISSSVKKITPAVPLVITKYLEYVNKLKHDQAPDYNFCRKLFSDELKKLCVPANGKLIFKAISTTKETVKNPPKTPTKRGAKKADVVSANGHSVSDSDEEQPTPKRATKKPKVTLPSWKDCPTAKASNVIKAGEYVSSNPKAAKRERK